MLKVIPHCDVKPSMTVQIKTMISVLDVSTCIITNTARTARFSKKSLGSDVGEIKKKVGVDTAKCPRKMEHGDLL